MHCVQMLRHTFYVNEVSGSYLFPYTVQTLLSEDLHGILCATPLSNRRSAVSSRDMLSALAGRKSGPLGGLAGSGGLGGGGGVCM